MPVLQDNNATVT